MVNEDVKERSNDPIQGHLALPAGRTVRLWELAEL